MISISSGLFTASQRITSSCEETSRVARSPSASSNALRWVWERPSAALRVEELMAIVTTSRFLSSSAASWNTSAPRSKERTSSCRPMSLSAVVRLTVTKQERRAIAVAQEDDRRGAAGVFAAHVHRQRVVGVLPDEDDPGID